MNIKQETLEHYDRMIAWAETQPSMDKSDFAAMVNAIGDSWCSTDCPYCKGHYHDCRTFGGGICCDLFTEKGCCDGKWEKLNESEIWEDWIKNAKKTRAYIQENG